MSEFSPCFWVAEEFHNFVRLGNIFVAVPVSRTVRRLVPSHGLNSLAQIRTKGQI